MEIGNQVVLISGGCWMTVESVTVTHVHCVWFDDGGQVRRDTFPLQAVRAVK
jgi:uncharacterized protein YodC (DUF2158 family)